MFVQIGRLYGEVFTSLTAILLGVQARRLDSGVMRITIGLLFLSFTVGLLPRPRQCQTDTRPVVHVAS